MRTLIRSDFTRPDQATIAALRAIATEKGLDFDRDVAPRLFNHPGELFTNETYQVIREDVGGWWHLSIKCIGKNRTSRWQDFQQIKNELVGAEYEAVELYPAESRLVDLADQYHLWASKDAMFRFPVGFPVDGIARELRTQE